MSDNYILLVVGKCKLFSNDHCTSDEMFYQLSHYDCFMKKPIFLNTVLQFNFWTLLESENVEWLVLHLMWFMLDEK